MLASCMLLDAAQCWRRSSSVGGGLQLRSHFYVCSRTADEYYGKGALITDGDPFKGPTPFGGATNVKLQFSVVFLGFSLVFLGFPSVAL